MKSIFLGIAGLALILSCNQEVKEQEKKTPLEVKTQSDSIAPAVEVVEPKAVMSKTDSLLNNPFDLIQYKKKKRGANSGGCEKEDYYFEPDTVGLYYSYFLIGGQQMGYVGKDKTDIVTRINGVEFNVFKPKDKDWTSYYDPNEVLVEFMAKFNDFDLPELAFIGLDKEQVIEELGEPSFTKADCLVYTFEDKALLLHVKYKVDWLKYVHLKEELTKDEYHAGLFRIHMFQ